MGLSYPFLLIFSSGLMVPSFINAQKALVHDTTYYVTYPGTIVGRFYFSKKYSIFRLPAANEGQSLEYKPNTPLTMGIGATYNNLTLNLAYGFGFLNNGESKGKTKSIDLQFHLYPHKWALDILAIKHKGVYSESSSYPVNGHGNYYYRPDIQQLFFGFSGYRVLNPKRFSFNAAMVQNEWQKKSAGSFLIGGLVYYGQIKGDSSLVPKQPGSSFPYTSGFNNINSFSVGIGGGYAYTLVVAKHFYLTGSLVANLKAAFSAVENAHDKKNKTSIKPSTIYKAAIGYNSDSWNISANWAANDLWVGENLFSDDISISAGNYRLVFSKKIALRKH